VSTDKNSLGLSTRASLRNLRGKTKKRIEELVQELFNDLSDLIEQLDTGRENFDKNLHKILSKHRLR
jgi:DNA relaxase NicK